ncbi:MAG: glycosyltransferase family 2 protein [Lachnospiraceae bacterium]|nr:glycosyltransferase family 2 protein [Lachnospiraceae bacterium]
MAHISIIIPCYNASPYIDRCLTSITTQTIGIDFLKIICIDDASTDDTWQRLSQWEQLYPDNILLVHFDTRAKQGAARNVGMQYVDTPYVSYLDADDWIEPDYFSIMYTYATKFSCEVVCCSFERDFSTELTYLTNRGTERSTRFLVIDSDEKRKFFLHVRSMGYSAWGKLLRTDFLNSHGIYFLENIAYEDNFWSSLLHLYAEHVVIVEEKLYHYFVNPNSTIMKENADYHTDYITVYLLLWREWIKRGFYPHFKHELEYDYLYSFYFCFLRILIVRYTTPSYSLFLLLKQLFLERVPDYCTNPYIDEHFSDFHKLMLQPLSTPICKKDFLIFAEHAKVYWKIQAQEQ